MTFAPVPTDRHWLEPGRRALVAWFWKTPYNRTLVRWNTELHYGFMLPHFVAQDFQEVLADLQRRLYPLAVEWFAPHLEFRFRCTGR